MQGLNRKELEDYVIDLYHNQKKTFREIQKIVRKSPRDIRAILDNNKMERMNGEVRDREKVMRSLKKSDTPVLTGYQMFHNYIRPHMALDGKTPAEMCGIEISGDNKWKTIIENASKKCP